jgi:hypothetical protein
MWEKTEQGQSTATALAADDSHLYAAQDVLRRVNPGTGQYLAFDNGAFEVPLPARATGMASVGSQLAVAIGSQNRIIFVNKTDGAQQRAVEVPGAASLFVTPDGKLGGVSGGKVFVLEQDTPHTIIIPGMNRIHGATVNGAGHLLLSDGETQTVKIFDRVAADAGLLQELGEPGGHRPGPWNPQRLEPGSVAVQELSSETPRVWVQGGAHPRRTTVWSPGGKLLKDYIGTTGYKGNGGLMSDDIATMGIVDGIICEIDYTDQSYTPVEIMGGSPDHAEGKHALFHAATHGDFANPYHFISNASGKDVEYFIQGGSFPKVFIRRGDRWHCVAAFASKRVMHGDIRFGWPGNFPQPKHGGPNDKSEVFAWNDTNGDGYQDPGELQWHQMPRTTGQFWFSGGWGYRCDDQLNWYSNGHVLRPARFTDEGAPVYDLAKVEQLPGDAGQAAGEIYKTRFGYMSMIDIAVLTRVFIGYDSKGRRRWSYPNYWFGVHGGMTSPRGVNGNIVSMMKVTGVVDMGDWDYLSIRGNYGQEFLLRSDGVYLGTVFIDNRMVPDELPPEWIASGTPISTVSLGEECFAGWTARQDDGRVRLTSGYTNVHVYEITGFESLGEITPQPLALTPQLAAACEVFEPVYAGPAVVTTANVPRGGKIPADPKAFDDTPIVIRSGRAEAGKARLAYDDTNLYVAWYVYDASPMVNKGGEPRLAFKSGDSVNLFITPDLKASGVAGTRILLTEITGARRAIVYQPESGKSAPFEFQSPVRAHTYAYVAEEPAISWDLKRVENTYVVSAVIPWSVLGIAPESGLQLKADLGIILGRDDTTTHVSQRPQWVDEQTNVVNDVPTESEFFPERWGTLTLE